MAAAAFVVSLIALAATIVPPIIFFGGGMTLDRMQLWMLIATAVWFVSAPMWMDRKS